MLHTPAKGDGRDQEAITDESFFCSCIYHPRLQIRRFIAQEQFKKGLLLPLLSSRDSLSITRLSRLFLSLSPTFTSQLRLQTTSSFQTARVSSYRLLLKGHAQPSKFRCYFFAGTGFPSPLRSFSSSSGLWSAFVTVISSSLERGNEPDI